MKPGDADSLASALHAVLSSDETCRRVGGRAKDDVQKYSASSIAAKWRQLYEAVLSEQTEVIFNGHKR
jgi:glycosyltransferase involved in cell wall biosynthesis